MACTTNGRDGVAIVIFRADGFMSESPILATLFSDGFAGIALQSGDIGDRIQVAVRGTLHTKTAFTVAVSDVSDAVHADTSGTPSNNPEDIVKVSTNNMPIGQVARVRAVGAAGTGEVDVSFKADGLE